MLKNSCVLRESTDIIISGGGLVGAATTAALQQLRQRTKQYPNSGVSKLMMVDVAKRPTYDPSNVMHTVRTVSITPVSSKIIDNLGGWESLTTKHSYYRIAVRHEQANSPYAGEGSRSTSFFVSSVLGSKSTSEPLLEFTDLRKPVGFICYNAELNAEMIKVVEANATEHDTLRYESKLEAIKLPDGAGVDGPLGTASLVTGDSTTPVEFGLLLGCEGRGSPLRDVMHTPSLQHDYAQVGFVCNVRFSPLVDGNVCAFQNFFRDGKIIAFLPTSPETANIVFTTTAAHAKELLAKPQSDLVDELNRRLHDFAPHDIPKVLEVPEGEVRGKMTRAQGCFPLKLNVATVPYAPRALLLGDAAHGIHPFAGQGLNLGIYDICALAGVLESAVRAGQDVGSTTAVGQVFAGEMLAHTAPMISGMEVIKKLLYGLPGVSSVGMKALNSLPIVSSVGKDAILQVSSGALFAKRHKGNFLLN